jgi:nucleoside-diphosphate-sugar epimerase
MGKRVEFSNSDTPAGETNRRLPDISKIELLGFTQTTKLENGLKDYCDWYMSSDSIRSQ